ncbi:MAG: hypothetical protein QOJ25_1117 [Solirubrobacteraceae bacterium]|jgi:hypothetical protein|nr:hypothetical protein [Solirubrobacteraceae bacterium]
MLVLATDAAGAPHATRTALAASAPRRRRIVGGTRGRMHGRGTGGPGGKYYPA